MDGDGHLRDSEIRDPAWGVNQRGVRNHNERLVLSLIQRHGGLPGIEIARRTGLSPQTASVIVRSLEREGLLDRGEPQRGRVGKPSVPMTLRADGVFSIGVKIGRRSIDVALMDFSGEIRLQLQETYLYPAPAQVLGFIEKTVGRIRTHLGDDAFGRVVGVGVATPFELWNWHEALGAQKATLAAWKDISLAAEIERIISCPVHIENDATAACRAEHVFGHGPALQDFAYFFVASFVGGGIVINHSVYEGRGFNAGAFGSLPVEDENGSRRQLIDLASIHRLEATLEANGHDVSRLWSNPQDWSGFDSELENWVDLTARHLARAAVAVSAVIDFEAIVFDGAFPESVRGRLVSRICEHMQQEDTRGVVAPRILEGRVGSNARAIGAACIPIFAQLLLNGAREIG